MMVLDARRVSIRLYVGLAAVSSLLAVISIFSRIEDGTVGLVVWGGYLLGLGLVQSIVLLGLGRPAGWWSWWMGSALTAVLIGGFTLWFAPTGSIALLIWSVAVWSVVAGGSSLVQGFRQDKKSALRSDWTTIGGGTMGLGLLVLIVPPEVYWLMGLAGVWAAMVTVFVIIAALSARTAVADQNGDQEDNS